MNKLLAALLLILAVAQTQAVAANFSVSGGYLIDPTGTKFIPEGTNVAEYNMPQIHKFYRTIPAIRSKPCFPSSTIFG